MEEVSGKNYITLSILAAASLGLEVLLAFWIEPMIYGSPINEWTDFQIIIHWVVACSLWCAASWRIIRFAKKKYNFDLFQKGSKMTVWQWALVAIFVIGSLILSYFFRLEWKQGNKRILYKWFCKIYFSIHLLYF